MKNSNDVVIVAAARTPIGKFGEAFRTLRAHELAARVITEVLKRANVPADLLDDVILGDCVQCPDEANTARTAALKAGVPVEVPAVTIQRQCSSAMAALAFAAQQIKAGDSQFILAGGVESMSSAPYVLKTARWGQRLTHGEMTDAMWEMLHSGSNLLEKEGVYHGPDRRKPGGEIRYFPSGPGYRGPAQPQQRRSRHQRRENSKRRSSRCPSPRKRAIPKWWTPTNMSVTA